MLRKALIVAAGLLIMWWGATDAFAYRLGVGYRGAGLGAVGYRGATWRGAAWRGAAWHGAACHGAAWRRTAWRGAAWGGLGWGGTGWGGAAWPYANPWALGIPAVGLAGYYGSSPYGVPGYYDYPASYGSYYACYQTSYVPTPWGWQWTRSWVC
jgi:hypothetical protein